MELLESDVDKREQYTRRLNLRFSGIAEAPHENTNELVINIIQKLGLNDIGKKDLEGIHRLRNRTDEHGRPRNRLIIARFQCEAVGDEVFRRRKKLKDHNHQHPDDQIYTNEDLIAKRTAFLSKTRYLKKQNKEGQWLLDLCGKNHDESLPILFQQFANDVNNLI